MFEQVYLNENPPKTDKKIDTEKIDRDINNTIYENQKISIFLRNVAIKNISFKIPMILFVNCL